MNIPDSLSAIAVIIQRDWKKMYFGARPYVEAMRLMNSMNDTYGSESAASIIRYFLSNAQNWRGETAKAVKQKLHDLLKKQPAL